MNSTFRVKSGDTRREIRIAVEEDGQTFDLSDVETATLVVVGLSRLEFVMEKSEEDGELFRQLSADEYAAIGTGRRPTELVLAYADGTESILPTVGVNYLVIDSRL